MRMFIRVACGLLLSLSFVSRVQAEPTVKTAAVGAVTGKTTQVLVDNTTVTLMPATALAGRRGVELQNLGPNPIYCTVGGETPLTTGALGRRIDASGGTWSVDVGSGVIIRCLAGTADQATTAATQVTELR